MYYQYLTLIPGIESKAAESDNNTGLQTALYVLIALLVLLVAVLALVCWRRMQKLKGTVAKSGKEVYQVIKL